MYYERGNERAENAVEDRKQHPGLRSRDSAAKCGFSYCLDSKHACPVFRILLASLACMSSKGLNMIRVSCLKVVLLSLARWPVKLRRPAAFVFWAARQELLP